MLTFLIIMTVVPIICFIIACLFKNENLCVTSILLFIAIFVMGWGVAGFCTVDKQKFETINSVQIIKPIPSILIVTYEYKGEKKFVTYTDTKHICYINDSTKWKIVKSYNIYGIKIFEGLQSNLDMDF